MSSCEAGSITYHVNKSLDRSDWWWINKTCADHSVWLTWTCWRQDNYPHHRTPSPGPWRAPQQGEQSHPCKAAPHPSGWCAGVVLHWRMAVSWEAPGPDRSRWLQSELLSGIRNAFLRRKMSQREDYCSTRFRKALLLLEIKATFQNI